MKTCTVLLLAPAAFAILTVGPVVGQVTRPEPGNPTQQLQSVVDSMAGPATSIRNAVLYVTKGDGSFTWSGAAGVANQSTQAPMTKDTPIVMASVTKLFTATAIMMLYEQGKVRLTDPMARYLPQHMIHGTQVYRGHDYSAEIRVEQLLAQTSGIPDYYDEKGRDGRTVFEIMEADPSHAWTVDQEIARVRNEMRATFKPGEKAFYGDTNFQLLGKIVEASTGKPLETVFEELFFRPLGMKHTWLAARSRPDETPSVPVADVYWKDALITNMRLSTAYWAYGGIISTPQDCVSFLKALNQGKIIKPDTLEKMHQWRVLSNPGMPFQYGYGTMRFEVPAANNQSPKVAPIWGASGSTGSFLYYAPDLDVYIAGTTDQVDDKMTPLILIIKAMTVLQHPNGPPDRAFQSTTLSISSRRSPSMVEASGHRVRRDLPARESSRRCQRGDGGASIERIKERANPTRMIAPVAAIGPTTRKPTRPHRLPGSV
jgi:D-alanyl-D-alanine carboxypeptidase